MCTRNSLRTFIAFFLLTLSTGSMLVKSAHCVLIPHEVGSVVSHAQTAVDIDNSDNCPICAFDFYPVLIQTPNLLPAPQTFSYSDFAPQLSDVILRQSTHLFLLRAPPAV